MRSNNDANHGSGLQMQKLAECTPPDLSADGDKSEDDVTMAPAATEGEDQRTEEPSVRSGDIDEDGTAEEVRCGAAEEDDAEPTRRTVEARGPIELADAGGEASLPPNVVLVEAATEAAEAECVGTSAERLSERAARKRGRSEKEEELWSKEDEGRTKKMKNGSLRDLRSVAAAAADQNAEVNFSADAEDGGSCFGGIVSGDGREALGDKAKAKAAVVEGDCSISRSLSDEDDDKARRAKQPPDADFDEDGAAAPSRDDFHWKKAGGEDGAAGISDTATSKREVESFELDGRDVRDEEEEGAAAAMDTAAQAGPGAYPVAGRAPGRSPVWAQRQWNVSGSWARRSTIALSRVISSALSRHMPSARHADTNLFSERNEGDVRLEAVLVDEEEARDEIRMEILAEAMQVEIVEIETKRGVGYLPAACGRTRRVLWISFVLAVLAALFGLATVLSRERRDESGDLSSAGEAGGTIGGDRAPALEAVTARGSLICGVKRVCNVAGFCAVDEEGTAEGFLVDLCRAVAAAALGSPDSIELKWVTWEDRFMVLAAGEVDVLVSGDTHTFERDVYQSEAGTGFTFSIPYLYDSLTFAGIPRYVSCAEEHTVAGECADLRLCIVMGSTWMDVLRGSLPGMNIVAVSSVDEYFELLGSGTCNAVAGERPYISEAAARGQGYAGDYVVSGVELSAQPLGIVTREDDAAWSDLVNWVVQALLAAEERNVTQDTAETMMMPAAAFGDEQRPDMFRDVIAAVGNYGELYSRHLEAVLPRQPMNTLNAGESGLIFSHPLGKASREGPGPVEGGRLERIQRRGHLLCGRSAASAAGGLDSDFCRAVAAAIFKGDRNSVVFAEFGEQDDGLEQLAGGAVDVLSGGSTKLVKDTVGPSGHGILFTQPYYYPTVDSNDDKVHALATQDDDPQWSAFVYWVVAATFFAEAVDIVQDRSIEMPEVNLFGRAHTRMFRDVIFAVGNYAEMYQRHEEYTVSGAELPPRGGRNLLNERPFGPQHHPLSSISV